MKNKRKMGGFLPSLLIILLATRQTQATLATLAKNECIFDLDCVGLYRSGSKCLPSGKCTNPFRDGCLQSLIRSEEEGDEDHFRIRLCNSDDANDESSNCRSSPFEYPEIRVHNQAWEAAIFFSWIIQISLMEFLDVPVTIGMATGKDTQESSFYHVENNLPFSNKSYAWEGIRKANELGGNCLETEEECVNLIPDVWVSQADVMTREYADGQLDYLDGNGQVGKLSWYVPKYTAMKYPFAVNHLGLSQNREQVAQVFKRPTTWGDYCNQVSSNNCTLPDGVADWYPDSEEEAGMYFAPGYIGHFRATAENNCLENNSTCTGHIVAPPCTWSTFIETQTYWLDIPLKSSGLNHVNGGYSYSEMIQIWNAANATQSDVMMQWADPDTLLELYRNTDAEFTKVYLPTPSIECEAARLTIEERCSEDPVIRRGTKATACDNSAHISKKAIAISLRDSTLALSPAEQSPAYAFVQNFNIDQLQINQMLSHYGAGGTTGYAAREAVCTWISENTDYLQSLIPPNHPKVYQQGDDYEQKVTTLAYSVAFAALVYILLCTFITFRKRKAAIFVYAQVPFIFVVLFGLSLVAIGAILHGMEPDDLVCGSRVWLVSMGYTFELVPLIIKVTVLNHLMKASAQMRRVRINLNQLYFSVLVLAFVLAIYLLIWTLVDPPKSTEIRMLESDSITVTSYFGCRSESPYWQTGYNLWEGLLVLWASVLAFQSHNVSGEFNESKSLGMMSYSHLLFLLLRVIVSVVFEDDAYTSSMATSYLLSIDIIVAISIYLVPKMVSSGVTLGELGPRSRMSGSGSNRSGGGSSSFHLDSGPLAPLPDKPQRMSTLGTSSVQTSSFSNRSGRTSDFTDRMSNFSATDRISTVSRTEEEKANSKDENETTPINQEMLEDLEEDAELDKSELSLHGEALALNQMHERSSVGVWTRERPESTHSLDLDDYTSASTVYMLRQQIKALKKTIIQKDDENEDLVQMIAFLQHNQTAQEQEIQRLSTMNSSSIDRSIS